MNLCQGALQYGNSQIQTKRYYQAAGAMFLLWLFTVIAVNGINLFSLNRDTTAVDAKIAVIYHQFFPEAKQVISPKFRISQLLKGNQGSIELTFWTLVNKLSKTLKSTDITIEQLRFQNQTLTLVLATNNFASLENLQSKLKQEKVKVHQSQASTRGKQVVGTLELTL
jgi:general secretion pathway protein L